MFSINCCTLSVIPNMSNLTKCKKWGLYVNGGGAWRHHQEIKGVVQSALYITSDFVFFLVSAPVFPEHSSIIILRYASQSYPDRIVHKCIGILSSIHRASALIVKSSRFVQVVMKGSRKIILMVSYLKPLAVQEFNAHSVKGDWNNMKCIPYSSL